MIDALALLERQKADVLQEIAGLGDLRRGSITTTSGKCGKPTCHCATPGDPGHGPNHRLTRKVKGKTLTETFSSPSALRKAEREVAEFHRFQDLCEEVVVVSEKICQLRTVEDTLTLLEKNDAGDPSGNRTRSKRTAPHRLSGPPQDRSTGPGGNGDGDAAGAAALSR